MALRRPSCWLRVANGGAGTASRQTSSREPFFSRPHGLGSGQGRARKIED